MSKRINNKFGYWCLGWMLIIRHPIKRPMDLGRVMELVVSEDWITPKTTNRRSAKK